MSAPTPSHEFSVETRYDPSIYDTPFASLPNPKRVWLGTPSSELEGIGRMTIEMPFSDITNPRIVD